METWNDYGNGIIAIDAGYVRPHLAAIHLIVDDGRVAFVDTGTNSSLATALAALDRLGLAPTAVDYVLLTHVHLDHAGGAGAMMAAFPLARLVVHPRGARHMVDPARLLAGVTAVYGAEATQRLYGRLLPVPPERIVEVGEGFALSLGGRAIRCLDTPGHARHHLCYHDTAAHGMFTGDTFGLSYREFDCEGRSFIFPTTTPVQFEPAALHVSIDRIVALQPEAVYLTHYSRLTGVPEHARTLHRLVDALVAVAEAAPGQGAVRQAAIRAGVARLLLDEVHAYGSSFADQEVLALWESDIELNAQGLGVWLDTRA
jgi:glyoxylase-like metal-dependent hydrolase (beta-lactamase superfamily II)